MAVSNWFDQLNERYWESGDTDDEVRFALIGLGWFTVDAALPAIKASDRCRATVAVSSSREKATSLVDDHAPLKHGITYDDFHEGQAAEHYDAVYVGTPNGLHLPFVETAADLGKAVLCEKPMEATVERAEAIVDAWMDADEPLMVAYRMQTDPVIRRTREFIDAGGIGTPKYALGEMSQVLTRKILPDPEQWRLDPELSGGCALIDLGIYPLNTLRYLLDAEPRRVQGMVTSTQEMFEQVDEYTTFEIRFGNDLTAACVASQNSHQSDQLRIVGTEGRVDIDPVFFGDVAVSITRDGEQLTFRNDETDQLEEEFEYFATCVLMDREPFADEEHGLTDMRTMDAIYRSAETGKSIKVTDTAGQ